MSAKRQNAEKAEEHEPVDSPAPVAPSLPVNKKSVMASRILSAPPPTIPVPRQSERPVSSQPIDQPPSIHKWDLQDRLISIPDGIDSPECDRAIAAALCHPDTNVLRWGDEFTLACRKRCPMTILALIHKGQIPQKRIIENIHKYRVILHEDVHLPNMPGNGHYNALHIACEHGLSTLMKLLISKFHFHYDKPRYDGYTPMDIIYYHLKMGDWHGPKLGEARVMIRILKKCTPQVTEDSMPPSSSQPILIDLTGSEHPIQQAITSRELLATTTTMTGSKRIVDTENALPAKRHKAEQQMNRAQLPEKDATPVPPTPVQDWAPIDDSWVDLF